MRPIELEFLAKGFLQGGVFMLPPQHALDMLLACRERGIRVFGLDAFRVTETTIQPVMEHSPDYSWPNDKNAWARAEAFLLEHMNSGFYFEVVADQERATVDIHVSVVRDGVREWRPVQAERLHNNSYRIVPQRVNRARESWQFEPGDTVLCESVESADGPIIAATRRAP